VTPIGQVPVRGKVRDMYEAGPDELLIVASDRISAFDVVLTEPIPDKGRVLTGLSLFWFERTAHIVPNHVVTADSRLFPEPYSADQDLAGRAMLVQWARVIPVECVARGYLAGSGWAQYRDTGAVCGVELPPGLLESEKLAEPIFTPTTKARQGHDLPLTLEETSQLVGRGLAERLKELTIAVYELIAEVASAAGVVVADTKLEFGFVDRELALIDEVGTPDSSRFWPADHHRPGGPQTSLDKQYVRDWLDQSGWNHEPPPPSLPGYVIERTAAKYREAYELLTGETFEAYRERMQP
jgi:phosphoribosylaminoimidazole-succinocarboxamide synthase